MEMASNVRILKIFENYGYTKSEGNYSRSVIPGTDMILPNGR